MKDPFVVATSDSTGSDFVDSATGWQCFFVVGFGLTVLGLLEVALLFVAPKWSSLEWEFATIGSAFESLPLLTIGVGMMAAAALASRWKRMRSVIVLLSFLVSLLLLIMGTVFALDFAPLLRVTTDPNQLFALKVGSLKTGLEAAVYFLLYLALGVWTWRRNRRTRAGGVT